MEQDNARLIELDRLEIPALISKYINRSASSLVRRREGGWIAMFLADLARKGIRPAAATAQHVEAHERALLAAGGAPGTTQRKIIRIAAFLEWLRVGDVPDEYEPVAALRWTHADLDAATFEAAVDEWIGWNSTGRLRTLAPTTLRNYTGALTMWGVFLVRIDLDWRAASRATFAEYALARGLSHRTLGAEAPAIRLFYRWAAAEGATLTATSPVTGIRWRRLPLPAARFLNEAEAAALMGAYPDGTPEHLRNTAILETLYASAVRVSELVGLDVDDVNFDEQTIFLRHTKSGQERFGLLYERAVDAVERYIEDGRPAFKTGTPALFLSKRGRVTARAIQNVVREAGQRVGIAQSVHPHLIRYSTATHLHNGGADLTVVRDVLGHTDIGSTSAYIGMSLPRLAHVIDVTLPAAREAAAKRKRRAGTRA